MMAVQRGNTRKSHADGIREEIQTADGESGLEVTSVNGESFERLVTEIAMSKPYQVPSERILDLCEKCGIEYHSRQTFAVEHAGGEAAIWFSDSSPTRPP